ncbi:zf-TFIIB domain-containing protein [Desulfuromonas acetoxidans]|nr:zf-TFIIB domain-containing protein [Desulfuromonas acetoxidans]MBF0643945.1 zf-TFIIB domain-containing protein [Desulfuromonas acetoxidans]NVD23183.1 zf-TFIIB domain-containing protein [Desulfuromonas acetoxidans]NVE15576.1 zf-TFIIB domain-containing protein [Desulfuromonas acetoxidans]
MKDVWDEREKAFENQYFRDVERKQIEAMKEKMHEGQIRELCKNRCPKCGEEIQASTFRGVPLDQCPSCGGIWLGPNDLKILAEKDHRTWFDNWFHAGENQG